MYIFKNLYYIYIIFNVYIYIQLVTNIFNTCLGKTKDKHYAVRLYILHVTFVLFICA